MIAQLPEDPVSGPVGIGAVPALAPRALPLHEEDVRLRGHAGTRQGDVGARARNHLRRGRPLIGRRVVT